MNLDQDKYIKHIVMTRDLAMAEKIMPREVAMQILNFHMLKTLSAK